MNKTFKWALVVLIGISGWADAAIVYLKDGSQVHGTVVSATARDIQFHTPHGMLTIPTDQIRRIDYQEDTPPPATSEPAPVAAEPPPYWRPRPRARPVEMREEYPTDQLISFDFGLVAPLSNVDFGAGGGSTRNGDSGVLLGLQYLHDLNPKLSAGFQFDYFNRSQTSDQSAIPNSDTNVSGDSVLFLGVLKYSLTRPGWARPYILAGIGGNHTTQMVDATPLPGFSWSDTSTDETRRVYDDSAWGLASIARIGIDFDMRPTVFSLEMGWTGLFNPNYNPTLAGQDLGLTSAGGKLNALVFGARWGWRF